jgi:hypothetical protein
MIKQFSENGPVGVLKPCCTTLFEPTYRWRKTRQLDVRCTQSDASNHCPSLVDCIINISGFDLW